MKNTFRRIMPNVRCRTAQVISAILVCFLFTACVGWGHLKKPAYVIDGTIGTIGAIAIVGATQDSGDSGGPAGALSAFGLVLIASAAFAALITSATPGPKKVEGTAQEWPE